MAGLCRKRRVGAQQRVHGVGEDPPELELERLQPQLRNSPPVGHGKARLSWPRRGGLQGSGGRTADHLPGGARGDRWAGQPGLF